MRKSKETRIARTRVHTTLATTLFLFAAAMMITSSQQAYSLPEYFLRADSPNPSADDANIKIYQQLEQEPGNTDRPAPIPTTSPISPIIPIVLGP
jgi:hypothetical protein